MMCELCGKETELFKADVEGTFLNVCKNCAQFGKVIARVRTAPKIEKKMPLPVVKTKIIVHDYAQKIKSCREHLKLSQEDFAKHINEKISVVHHLETGKHEPDIALGEKLQKILKITLVEEVDEAPDSAIENKKSHADQLTIGDAIKIKTRKS